MLKFTARRSMPELVPPARPTPVHETKTLSAAGRSTGIQFFRGHHPVDDDHHVDHQRPLAAPADDRHHPAKAIKAALAEALVRFYPVAGRLRELPSGELVVDCTAEGAVFVEAAADVCLEELGQPLLPPYPCVEELLCDASVNEVAVRRPLLYMQVTQFKCGGFSLSFSICHDVADGFGMIQFIKAIADHQASGNAVHPVVLPEWQKGDVIPVVSARPPLCAGDIFPPHLPFLSCGSQVVSHGGGGVGGRVMLSSTPPSPQGMVTLQHFHLTREEIASLRRHVPAHLRRSVTASELLTVLLWRCRTVALGYRPDHDQRSRIVLTTTSLRGRWNEHVDDDPQMCHGNDDDDADHVSVHHRTMLVLEATVDDLCGENHLDHPLELVREAKLGAARPLLERQNSAAGVMALLLLRERRRRRPSSLAVDMERVYCISDLCRRGGEEVDLPWARWVVGGGPAARTPTEVERQDGDDGEEPVTVSVVLPEKAAVDTLAREMTFWLTARRRRSCL